MGWCGLWCGTNGGSCGSSSELAQLQEAAQQQALAAALVAQEDERQRIAAELHDGVGTILALAKLHLYAPGSQPSPEASALIDQAVAEVRRISRNLQPATLQQLGLAQALRALVQAVPTEMAPKCAWSRRARWAASFRRTS